MVTRNGVGRINDSVKLVDEAQYEVKHGLVKYKKFNTEEDADKFQKENDGWYKFHTEKGIFCASSVVVGISKKAVDKTSEYYKLNVPLGIDPQFGTNWKTCH